MLPIDVNDKNSRLYESNLLRRCYQLRLSIISITLRNPAKAVLSFPANRIFTPRLVSR